MNSTVDSVTSLFVHTGEHLSWYLSYKRNKEILQIDVRIIEIHLSSVIEVASNMQKADLMRNFERLTTDLNDQGEVWLRDINTIIQNLKSDLDKMESNHLDVLKNRKMK